MHIGNDTVALCEKPQFVKSTNEMLPMNKV